MWLIFCHEGENVFLPAKGFSALDMRSGNTVQGECFMSIRCVNLASEKCFHYLCMALAGFNGLKKHLSILQFLTDIFKQFC